MAFEIVLPDGWEGCPTWWKNLVTKIEQEANEKGVYTNSNQWIEYLTKKLKEEGLIYENWNCRVRFSSPEDYLIFKIKYGF